MNSQGPEQQIITQAAAEWAVRLHAGPLSDEAQAHLAQWLACDERHGPALQFAQQTWAALGELALEPHALKPEAHRLRPESPCARPAPVTRRRRPLRWVGRAAAVCMVLAVAWVGGPNLLVQMQADYRTGTGELRTVQLDDGSSVELDASSAIRIDYDTHERRISLLAGSAVFDVAPMGEAETRPFVVQSAGADPGPGHPVCCRAPRRGSGLGRRFATQRGGQRAIATQRGRRATGAQRRPKCALYPTARRAAVAGL